MNDSQGPSYFAATRHPLACLLFLVPLLAAYEIGVVTLSADQPGSLRNGADVWLRWCLERYGITQLWAAPLLVVGLFAVRSLLQTNDRPRGYFRLYFKMLLESALYAFLLWALSRNFLRLLDHAGVVLNQPSPDGVSVTPTAQILTYIGAGIYEEVIFRLGLFSIVCLVLRFMWVPSIVAGPVAAVACAVLFAAAHHIGPYGEWPINSTVFLFRVIAGILFTMIYVFRGFGIAVGAHAGYDILVGVSLPAPVAASAP